MLRAIIFMSGLAVTLWALPIVLEHHARAELFQLAWCSSSGSDVPGTGLFGMHCAACPMLLASSVAMVASIVRPVRRVRALKRAFA